MLTRFALAFATLLLVVGYVAGRPSFVHAATSRLIGTVGPGFDITVKNSSGRLVTLLPHGRYTIVVRDRSSIHDFHLIGPGLSRVITSVAFVGTKTVQVTLRPGRYQYQCDPHAFIMNGSFRVT